MQKSYSKNISFFLALFFFLIFSAPSFSQEQENSGEMDFSKQALLNEAVDEILELKKEKLTLKSQVEQLDQKYNYLLKALELFREGRKYEASEELKKIIAVDAEDSTVQFNLGLLLSELNFYDEASDLFSELITKEPDNKKLYANLGFLKARQKKFPEAKQLYLKALEIDSNFAIVHYNLGLIYKQLRQDNDALMHFNLASKIFGADSPWYKLSVEKMKEIKHRN